MGSLRACHCLCGVAHPLAAGVCDVFAATETRQFQTRSLGAVTVQVCRPCQEAGALWCLPDKCPAVICGGPHIVVRDGDAEAVVPAAASAADIELALGFARAMSSEED